MQKQDISNSLEITFSILEILDITDGKKLERWMRFHFLTSYFTSFVRLFLYLNKIMTKQINFALFLFIICISSPVYADGNPNPTVENRISLHLTDTEKAKFLSEMREMLVSIQGIITGIGTEDRELIARSAHNAGNRIARSTPKSILEKFPQSFKEIGGPTHLMFEELAIRAETDDMDMLAEFTGQLMRQCLACHSTFRAN